MAGKKRQASKKKVAGSFCRSSKCTSYSPPPKKLSPDMPAIST